MDPFRLELCVESARAAALAEEGGADRIELCRDLAAEGLTPSAELLRRTGARELHSSAGGEAGISVDAVRALEAAGSLRAR